MCARGEAVNQGTNAPAVAIQPACMGTVFKLYLCACCDPLMMILNPESDWKVSVQLLLLLKMRQTRQELACVLGVATGGTGMPP